MGRRRRYKERMILLQAIKYDKIKFRNEEDGEEIEEIHQRDEFHIVDLKLNKVHHHCLPSLARGHGLPMGAMVACGRKMFVFGKKEPVCTTAQPSSLNNYIIETESTIKEFYMGDSYIHFDPVKPMVPPSGGRWAGAPLTNSYSKYFTCLNGNVYSFPCGPLAPEVLHVGNDSAAIPPSCCWKSLPMPTHLASCFKPLPVIADPTNNRILVHLKGGQDPSSSSLYAFHPPNPKDDIDYDTSSSGTWKCLVPDVFSLRGARGVSLLDGVIYHYGRYFINMLKAYDLDTGKNLDVKWSSRFIEKDLYVDDCCGSLNYFNSLLCLDDTNKLLCLASQQVHAHHHAPDPISPYKTTMFFFTFRAERCDSTTVILTPLYTRSYDLLSTVRVHNFLLL